MKDAERLRNYLYQSYKNEGKTSWVLEDLEGICCAEPDRIKAAEDLKIQRLFEVGEPQYYTVNGKPRRETIIQITSQGISHARDQVWYRKVYKILKEIREWLTLRG